MSQAERSRHFDPVLMEIVSNDLGAIAEEMAAIIYKTGRSAMLKAGDFATMVCNARGQPIGQGVGATFQAFLFQELVQQILAKYGTRIDPDDVIVSNDRRGMTHLPDVSVAMPVFADGVLVGFVAAYSHHADVGGRFPGGQSQQAVSALEEGLRLPLVKLVNRGNVNQEALDIVLANVRMEEEWLADVQAKIAGCRRGVTGLAELVSKYGQGVFDQVCARLLDNSEQALRTALGTLPDGCYEAEDGIADDGSGAGEIALKLKVTIRGSEVVADFGGSSAQIPLALNMPLLFAKSAVIGGLHALLGHDIRVNSGFFRPIQVLAPRGCIVNPDDTYPVGARAPLFTRVFDMVFRSLAKAAPERMPVPHESGDAMHFSGTGLDGKFFAIFDVYFGGWGARPAKDGIDGVAPVYMGSYGSASAEMIERQYPVQVTGFGYVSDTAGAGRYRGSAGVYRAWKFTEPGKVMLRQLRLTKSVGLLGGKAGELGRTIITKADGTVVSPRPESHLQVAVQAGDAIYHSISGAGGFGDPWTREPSQVLEDVLDEKITAETAKREYGVVIHEGTVDESATMLVRKSSPSRAAAA
jgi:N-methylhydantoinase B